MLATLLCRLNLRHKWELATDDAPGTLSQQCTRCGKHRSARPGGGRRAHETWGGENQSHGSGYAGGM